MSSAAKVTKSFPGVEDGQVYPRTINVDEVVHGNLAAAAIQAGWAVATDGATEESPDPAAAAAGTNTQPPAGGQTGTELQLQGGATAVVEISDDWKAMKWPKLKALAESVKGSEVASPEDAKAVIEAELAKRAAAPAPAK